VWGRSCLEAGKSYPEMDLKAGPEVSFTLED
jgi:hypothetical protein